MTHTAQQIDALDAAYAAYLSAIAGCDEFAKATAIIHLDNVEMHCGAKTNVNRGQTARRVLTKAGRY